MTGFGKSALLNAGSCPDVGYCRANVDFGISGKSSPITSGDTARVLRMARAASMLSAVRS